MHPREAPSLLEQPDEPTPNTSEELWLLPKHQMVLDDPVCLLSLEKDRLLVLHGPLAQKGQTEHLLCSSSTLTHGDGHDQVAKDEVLSTGANGPSASREAGSSGNSWKNSPGFLLW